MQMTQGCVSCLPALLKATSVANDQPTRAEALRALSVLATHEGNVTLQFYYHVTLCHYRS